jgi:rubrerythrin
MATKHKPGSADTRVVGELYNRTGLRASPHAQAMLENAQIAVSGSPADFLAFRSALIDQAPPVGTMPRPASLSAAAKQAMSAATGEKTNVLLDQLAERLAFERGGTRLYETLILKHELHGSWSGGPTREELLQIRDEEASHFLLLERALQQLDADPTAVTPCADLGGVAASGLVQVICDPRSSLGESIEAILTAELVDNGAWERLVELSEELGYGELAEQLRGCERQEKVHLESARRWLTSRVQELAGAV